MGSKKIRKLMIDRELKLKDIADRSGFSEGYVSNVINGRYSGAKARKTIAAILNEPVERLWDGTSSAPRRGKKTATA